MTVDRGRQEKAPKRFADSTLIRRLWGYMAPYRALFVIGLVLLPIISAASLLQPHLIQLAIDDHITTGELDGLGVLVAIFAATVVGGFVVQFAQFFVMQIAGQRALRDLRVAVFEHLLGMRMSHFHRTPVGRLMTRVTTDIESLQEAFSSGMVTILGDLIALVAIVVILLVKDARLALATFAIVPLLAAVAIFFRILMRRAFRRVRKAVARINAFFQEAVSGMSVVQLFVQERRLRREFKGEARSLRDAAFDAIRWDATFYALIEALGAITTGVIIWYGSGGALEGAITLGLLISFIEYVEKFFRPIRDLTQKYALLQSAMASSERIFELLDTDEVVEEHLEAKPLETLRASVEFRDVWFAYRDEDWVLKDVSFTIPKGARIALVGHTGAGKSTITRLLTRMADVQRGQILIDGVDIREVSLRDLRALFTVVLQDTFLFAGSVRDNLSLHDDSVTADALQRAASLVRADRIIDRLEGRWDHTIAERGANLSAGERQLLSFARALAHEPEVLILDEATSSVDTETEQVIQEATGRLLQQQTSVVVAHRLSTIRHCDTILVFHHGELREQGTHTELVARGGLYETLYRLQYQSAA